MNRAYGFPNASSDREFIKLLPTILRLLPALLPAASLPSAALAAGVPIQVVNTIVTAVATGTTLVPFDDTIPQNTEGDQYMTLAITPTNANNKLKIDVVIHVECSAAAQVAAALFQDSTAGALAVSGQFSGIGETSQIIFTHYMTAGTTSATTFKVRAGPHAGGTLTVNGQSTVRLYGGVYASSITITEIRA